MLARRGVASAHPKWGAVTVAHYLIRRRVRLVDATRRYDDETIRNKVRATLDEFFAAGEKAGLAEFYEKREGPRQRHRGYRERLHSEPIASQGS